MEPLALSRHWGREVAAPQYFPHVSYLIRMIAGRPRWDSTRMDRWASRPGHWGFADHWHTDGPGPPYVGGYPRWVGDRFRWTRTSTARGWIIAAPLTLNTAMAAFLPGIRNGFRSKARGWRAAPTPGKRPVGGQPQGERPEPKPFAFGASRRIQSAAGLVIPWDPMRSGIGFWRNTDGNKTVLGLNFLGLVWIIPVYDIPDQQIGNNLV